MGGDHAKQEAATSLLRRDRRASASQETLGHLIYRCPGSRNHKPTTRNQHRVRCQQLDAKLSLHQELSHFTAATASSPVQSILPLSAARPVRASGHISQALDCLSAPLVSPAATKYARGQRPGTLGLDR